MKRKIAAIMAADVVSYSRLVAEDEEETIQRLLSYRDIFNDFVSQAGGRIFNTAGDAVLSEFPSAVTALRAAIEIQESIRTRNLAYPESRHMRFRIGMTIGDVIERDGDLLGDAVNVAARLEGLAEPGGICVSRNVYEQVGNKLGIVFRDIGPQKVKNIAESIHAFRIPVARLAEFAAPPDNTAANPVARQRLAWPLVLIPVAATLVALVTIVNGHRIPKVSAPPSASAAPTPRSAPMTTEVGEGAKAPAWKPNERIYGAAPYLAGATRPAPPTGLFDATRIPFLREKDRGVATQAMTATPNNAIAIADNGAFGTAYREASIDEARQDAMSRCLPHGDGRCAIFAVNGEIVWPRSLPPMPPTPWVDPNVRRTPFDATRLDSGGSSMKLAADYERAAGAPSKALALGPEAHWWHYADGATDDEAIRRALEGCGDITGAPCRIVAVDMSFVVDPGPPEEAVAQCDRLAAAPFDMPGEKGIVGVPLGELNDDDALPACRAALIVRPDLPRIDLELGRALQRHGGANAEALSLYQKALDGGDSAAMVVLGDIYEEGRLGVTKDVQRAVGLYRKAADAGNPQAMVYLAMMYSNGKGVQKDRYAADDLYQQANVATARIKESR